ncbi:hypothetical protein LOZ12_003101 [Ophidiomyces ophidiicola]|nr:hypothetical protein LOZ44_002297 [Ophidiomyces ophidiicola]KAI2081634.1 hypothetical protein LOZ37_001165 [Ophidiomyces ophidiicola]KAI2112837.1 hypothetical protein LOZ42_004596 [Ophidiomyces ophidiicola]KAI2119998.1 hypothetical protein LOZ32_002814 [Ophidiomyces ophidiicola]KAI2155763.1 hypothetical protein LOZ25_004368 [Ophidiomyces ophidiicola]
MVPDCVLQIPPDFPPPDAFASDASSLCESVKEAKWLKDLYTPQGLIKIVDHPVPLTRATSKGLHSAAFKHALYLPEFPKTRPDSHTYVINVKGWDEEKVHNIIEGIHYSHRRCHGRATVFCTFLNCFVRKSTYRCTGIKSCQYLDPLLRDVCHSEVNEQLWQYVQNTQQKLNASVPEEERRATITYYRNISKQFELKTACKNWTDSCRLIVHLSQRPDLCHPFVGCINAINCSEPEGRKSHYCRSLSGTDSLVVEYLKRICETGDENPPKQTCGIVQQTRTRAISCCVSHPQGLGVLQKRNCNVTFTVMVPADLTKCHFILFISHGVHNHVPPPPHLEAEEILEDVPVILHRLKASQEAAEVIFLQNPHVQSFCNQHNGQTFLRIQECFLRMDKYIATSLKEQILMYPHGEEIQRMMFDYQYDPPLKTYVKGIFNDRHGITVVCSPNEQFKAFLRLTSFKIDIYYKRVQSNGFYYNEVVFSGFPKKDSKAPAPAFLRVFTLLENALEYCTLFHRAFGCLSHLCKGAVKFHHIHRQGIRAVVMSPESMLLAGLGNYLNQIDPAHRPWQWQLQHVIVFSPVLFELGVDTTIDVGCPNFGTQVSRIKEKMMTLTTVRSWDEYTEICKQLCDDGCASKRVKDWARHKASSVIAAGINENFSLIERRTYRNIRLRLSEREPKFVGPPHGIYQSLVVAVRDALFSDSQIAYVPPYGEIEPRKRKLQDIERDSSVINTTNDDVHNNEAAPIFINEKRNNNQDNSPFLHIRSENTTRQQECHFSSPPKLDRLVHLDSRHHQPIYNRLVDNTYEGQVRALEHRKKRAELERLEMDIKFRELDLIQMRRDLEQKRAQLMEYQAQA